MNFEIFRSLMQAEANAVNELCSALRARSKIVFIERGQHLLLPGEISKYVYFVESGFFRNYRISNGLEETMGFTGENELMTSLKSFLGQCGSEEGICCERSARLLQISFHDWMAMEDLFIDFLVLSNRILKSYLIKCEEERNFFRMASTRDKYLFLTRDYPDIINIVSQKHIASFLGISAPTMSVMLKELLYKPN